MAHSTKVLFVLFVASLPFVLESSLEVYLFTLLLGPVMLFNATAHALGPIGAMVWEGSGVAFIALLAVILGQLILIRFKRLPVLAEFPRLSRRVAVFYPFHAVALISYESWSRILL